jgi:hypothetical protein
MSTAVFLRFLRSEDKATAMAEAIAALREGHTLQSAVYTVDPTSFRQVPGSPFAYWASERIRRLFAELPPFEGDGQTVRQGLATADDFRFVRAWWEVAPQTILDGTNGPDWREHLTAFQNWCRRRTFESKRWVPFAKGGAYSPYYADLHLAVNWERDGEEIRTFVDPETGRTYSRPQNTDVYFQPGLTWPLRTQLGFNMRAYPGGVIFGHKGPVAFVHEMELPFYLGLSNSSALGLLISLQMAFGFFEVGVIQRTSVPDWSGQDGKRLGELALSAVNLKRLPDTGNETSHVFSVPALLQVPGGTLAEKFAVWQAHRAEIERERTECQREIDDIAFHPYRIDGDDRRVIEGSLDELHSDGTDEVDDADSAEDAAEADLTADPRQLVADLLSYAVGCVFGRWDVRFATAERQSPALPDPFAPLPVCSPGMLTGQDGLPLHTVPSEYPLRISWDGILVDDTGLEGIQPHRDDIVYRVREVLDLLWGDRAEAVEQEACEILRVSELREYFRRPIGFFDHHLKRYSKSRRKAPIYWPLSTASGSYTVWVYYHRLTDQRLYTIVNRGVNKKIAEVERAIAGVEKDMASASGRQATQLRDRWQEARAFLAELHDFRQELLRVAALPYKPDLNDGVIINAAPLHRLFRHRQWAKDTRDWWERLEREAYEWAHMAYTIWPERVREVCRRDRSIAIAHGLEALYEPTSPSRGGGRRRQRG